MTCGKRHGPAPFLTRAERIGLTLIEVVIVVLMLGMMIGLLLPAVMSARESARNLQCQNNIRQIGLAMSGYAAVHKAFPYQYTPSDWEYFERNQIFHSIDSVSAHARLLPYLDAQAIYDRVSFGVMLQHNPARYLPGPSCFRCPSDEFIRPYGTSYWMCIGEYLRCIGPRELQIFQVPRGAFTYDELALLESFTDGLSNTVTFGEKLAGSLLPKHKGIWGRDLVRIESPDVFVIHRNLMIKRCSEIPSDFSDWWWTEGGSEWLSVMSLLDYNHILPPNSNIQDCGDISIGIEGISTARSHHPSKCNFVFADGRVVSISNEVDIGVYRAVSTRDGHEANHNID